MTRSSRRFSLIATSVALCLMSSPVWAKACAPSQDPSPASRAKTGIQFVNDTTFAMRVFWSDFDGFLKSYSGWIQPGENVSYATYEGHLWFIEINTPKGRECHGPAAANSSDTCVIRMTYDDTQIGYDTSFCDYNP